MPKLLLSTAVGSVAAMAVNLTLFGFARLAGLFGPSVILSATSHPLRYAAVIFASAFGVVGAAVLRVALGLLFERSMARWCFLALAGVAFVASLALPAPGLAGESWGEVLVLNILHLTTFAVALAAVEWGTRPVWGWGREPYTARSAGLALVSGATGGIGSEVVLELLRHGWTVIGLGRDGRKAEALRERAGGSSGSLELLLGDLALIAEAERLAKEANHFAGGRDFTLVVHAVGTLQPSSRPTAEGLDANVSTSWLTRVAVTRSLALAPDVRLVNIAAAESGRVPNRMRVLPHALSDLGTGMAAHGQAQLLNDVWVAILRARGVTAWGYGPGAVATDIRRELPAAARAVMAPLFWAETRAPADAAADVVRLALDRELHAGGFASRTGPFEHDPLIANRQSRLATANLIEAALRAAEAKSPTADNA